MNNQSLPWEQPDWLDNAKAWIHAVLEIHRFRLAGAIEQFHICPWSTVLRVPTVNGLFYFKATAPALAHEPALTDYLARLRPEILPDVLAVDLQRGWMLMCDSGTPLRALIKSDQSLARWRDILPLYVGLQKDLMAHVEQILTLGVLDRRLETLPDQFERLVADERSMLISHADGLSDDEYRRLKASVKDFERLCLELASAGIPATIHHDDFHDGNVFLQAGRVCFTDWGESAVTHPFFTLVVLLRGASNSLDLPSDAPELMQLRDWYLDQWTDYAPLAELQPVVHLAQRIGLVNRALTWHRVIANLPESLKSEYAIAIPNYLQEFINTD
jgi:hypothetical protein